MNNFKVKTFYEIFPTKGNCDFTVCDSLIERHLKNSGAIQGIVTLFVPGSTAAFMTIEYEPGLIKDFKYLMDQLISEKCKYFHDEKWLDGNGHSHLRASLISSSIVIPFEKGALISGQWQQTVLVDFDNRGRDDRKICIQIMGEFKY